MTDKQLKLKYANPQKADGLRDIIVYKVFPELRKRHYLTRADFMCCMSCASSALDTLLDKAKKPKKGYVYWHKQDSINTESSSSRYYRRYMQEEPNITIRYCANNGGLPDREASEATRRVGVEICEVLREFDLIPTWDGSPDTVICVEPKLQGREEIITP